MAGERREQDSADGWIELRELDLRPPDRVAYRDGTWTDQDDQGEAK